MEKQFNSGDIVQVRSGGPLMTVEKCSDHLVSCLWWIDGLHDFATRDFAPNLLRTASSIMQAHNQAMSNQDMLPCGSVMRNAMEKPTILEVVPLIRAYYAKPGNGNGGNLHTVLEDPNYEDGHVQQCLEVAQRKGDTDGAAIAEKMLLMSRTQRKKLGSMSHYPMTVAV